MKTYKVLREEIEKNIKKYEEYVDRFNQINEARPRVIRYSKHTDLVNM